MTTKCSKATYESNFHQRSSIVVNNRVLWSILMNYSVLQYLFNCTDEFVYTLLFIYIICTTFTIQVAEFLIKNRLQIHSKLNCGRKIERFKCNQRVLQWESSFAQIDREWEREQNTTEKQNGFACSIAFPVHTIIAVNMKTNEQSTPRILCFSFFIAFYVKFLMQNHYRIVIIMYKISRNRN